MLGSYVIATVSQKVLSFLAKFSDKEFYERDVARRLGIAYGSANRSLNELYSTGAIRRRRAGKMYFYSIDISNAAILEYKKLVNLTLIEPLIEELKKLANRIILYGSCSQGTDISRSDFDLFIVTNNRAGVSDVINAFTLRRGYEELRIQPIIKTSIELLQTGESERAFIEEVERGIVLWERAASESRV